MRYFRLLSTTATLACLAACGGGSSDSEPTPEVVAEEDSYNAVLVENAAADLLKTSISAEAEVLTINSNGFPNRITSVQLADGQLLNQAADIAQWFELSIDAITGRAKISSLKTLDFETDPEFFVLQLQLGQRNVSVRIDVYDIQNGTSDEALKISSYGEMLSFFNGHFESENIGFDIIDLGQYADSQQQNRDGIHIALGRDIDASPSQQTPWQGKLYKGSINGNNHVIQNLKTTWAPESIQVGGSTVWPRGFVVSANRFEPINISNLGFVETDFNSVLFSIEGNISNVFIDGIYRPYNADTSSLDVLPFRLSGLNSARQVYTNVLYDLRSIGSQISRMSFSGMLGYNGSSGSFESGYSNGAVITADNLRVDNGARFGGFSERCGPQFSLSKPKSETFFYSAIDYQISDLRGGPAADRPYISVGGLADARCDFYSDAADKGSSDYTWRFVSDRNGNSKPRLVAGLEFDTNNDGIADVGSVDGRSDDLALAAINEADLTEASSFTGPWQEDASPFAIDQGQYPVLKNMPYPHTEGASWMSAEDPGVEFQRLRYNRYLSQP